MIHGIDVARYQSDEPNLTGSDFCVIKATEGTSYVSPAYAKQLAHARSAGVVVGHYHYSHEGGTAEADYFLKHADIRAGEFVAFDWEETSVSQAERDAWMKHVKSKKAMTKTVLYCNKTFWRTRDTESYAGDGLWIADPSSPAGKPDVDHAWVIHQYGIKAGTDENVANFASRAAMATWAAGTPPVVTPPATKPPAGKAPVKPTPVKPPVVKAPPKPAVDLSNLVAAARRDPKLRQGGTTHAADVQVVEAALRSEGLLSATYASDGSWGTSTVAAYRSWQIRCGYHSVAADGIPGKASLTKLGAKRGFTVKA